MAGQWVFSIYNDSRMHDKFVKMRADAVLFAQQSAESTIKERIDEEGCGAVVWAVILKGEPYEA